MKIIYFTTAMNNVDFQEFNKQWKFSLNPSNQNFHFNLIHSLAINNTVEVISVRPYSKKVLKASLQAKEIKDENISWHYVSRKSKFDNLISKVLALNIRKTKGCIILVDTMNLKLLLTAKFYGKQRNIPVIGICTDSPFNLTSVKKRRAKLMMRKARNLKGYICLTEGLNALYNKKQRPYVVINGVSNNFEIDKKLNFGNYILFAGSLLRKYGVYKLIDAVNMLKKLDFKLVICGHTQEEDFLTKISNNSKINYLGCVDQQTLATLEYHALMCVNPRPLDEDLDNLSFPSKIIEYLNNSRLVISTKDPLLMPLFKTHIIWVDSLDSESFSQTIQFALEKDKKDVNDNKEKVQQIIAENYSPEIVNKKLNAFLNSFVRK